MKDEVKGRGVQDNLYFLIYTHFFPALPQGGYQQFGSERAWKEHLPTFFPKMMRGIRKKCPLISCIRF